MRTRSIKPFVFGVSIGILCSLDAQAFFVVQGDDEVIGYLEDHGLVELLEVELFRRVTTSESASDSVAAAAQLAPIYLQGIESEDPGEGVVESYSFDGIVITVPSENEEVEQVVIGLENFRFVGTDWTIPDSVIKASDDLRIAQRRFERGDFLGADRIVHAYLDDAEESDSDAARIVVQSRLAAARIQGDIFGGAYALYRSSDSVRNDLDWLDGRYGVSPSLPLISGLVEIGGPKDPLADFDSNTDLMLELYRLVHSDDNASVDVEEFVSRLKKKNLTKASEKLGVNLCIGMIQAQLHRDPEVRKEARRWLRTRGDSDEGSWMWAWTRLGIAGSYLYESKQDENQSRSMVSNAVLEYIKVMISEHEDIKSYGLDHLAKKLAVRTLRMNGRDEEALRLQLIGHE